MVFLSCERMVFDDRWRKGENIFLRLLRNGFGFVVARLNGPFFVVEVAEFEDFMGWRLIGVGMVQLPSRLLDFYQVFALRGFAVLIVESVRECVLLIFEDFFAAGNGGVLADIALLVLSDFLEGGWEDFVPLGLSVPEGRTVILFVYFERSKGSTDHTVNYNVIIINQCRTPSL